VQSDGGAGVVTSEPRGISCGTALNICAADFRRGSRITLRADADGFLAWRSNCEEGSGGTQLTCVVTLDADLTVHVEFRPPPPTGHFTLGFEIHGPGSVSAGDIDCREESQPANCSEEFVDGARVSVTAFPSLDWLGSDMDATFTGWSGDAACSALGARVSGFLTIDHDVHCIAEFRAPNLHLLRISVSGAGTISDDPPHDPDQPGIRCREGLVGGPCQTRLASTGTVPLRATPDFGYRFVSWGGDCASYGTATQIAALVADNMSCTATFEHATTPQSLTVVYARGAPFKIIVSEPAGIECFAGAGSDCTESYLPGTEVVLHSDIPGVFWLACDSVLTDSVTGRTFCHVLMDQQPRTISATFPPD